MSDYDQLIKTNKEIISKDPNKFIAILMEMNPSTLNEIYPETGSILNILKCYTFDEAVEAYIKWSFTE